MVNQKQSKKEINLIQLSIKLDTLALDSHPIDTKIGNKTSKRTIKLDYVQDGGIVKVPAHLWMYGWLKELFKSKAKGTVVHLPSKLDMYPIGDAKDILVGKSKEEWAISGDKTVPYELGEEIKAYEKYPYHEYVVTQVRGGGSIVKYYYKINDKSKLIPLEIYTLIPPELIIDNMKNLGKVYGLGGKAHGYRIGTFSIEGKPKIVKIGEVVT